VFRCRQKALIQLEDELEMRLFEESEITHCKGTLLIQWTTTDSGVVNERDKFRFYTKFRMVQLS
jgi:hypothetical protein